MNILQDMLGLFKRKPVSTPNADDLFVISRKTRIRKELQPEPGVENNLIKFKDIKANILFDTKYIIPLVIEGDFGDSFDITSFSGDMVYVKHAPGNTGSYDIVIPDATSPANKYRQIRFISDNTTNSNQTAIRLISPSIDGSNYSNTGYGINEPYEGVTLWSDGTQWIVIQAKSH